MPVDKHDSDKKLPHSPDPLGGVKGQIFKFAISCQYFSRKFRVQTKVQKYETYQTWFSTKACVSPPGWTLRMGSKGQDSTLSEHRDPPLDPGYGVRSKFSFYRTSPGHVVYEIKENQDCSNMLANILPADLTNPHPPTLGMVSVG